jgi:hypothetical protein
VQTGEDRGHDSEHPLSSFVHGGASYTFRLLFAHT